MQCCQFFLFIYLYVLNAKVLVFYDETHVTTDFQGFFSPCVHCCTLSYLIFKLLLLLLIVGFPFCCFYKLLWQIV